MVGLGVWSVLGNVHIWSFFIRLRIIGISSSYGILRLHMCFSLLSFLCGFWRKGTMPSLQTRLAASWTQASLLQKVPLCPTSLYSTCPCRTPALVQQWLLCIRMKILCGFLLVSKHGDECSPCTGEAAPRGLAESGETVGCVPFRLTVVFVGTLYSCTAGRPASALPSSLLQTWWFCSCCPRTCLCAFPAFLVLELAVQHGSGRGEIGMFSGGFWESFYFPYKMGQMCLVPYFPTSCFEHKCVWSRFRNFFIRLINFRRGGWQY